MSMDLLYSQAMRKCACCDAQLQKRQRTYCSRTCQAKGVARQNSKALVATRPCDFCGTVYTYHPEWKQDRNTKYCARECKDVHQRITYTGDGNPTYGTTWSEEQRHKHEISTAVYWSSPENREQHRTIMQDVIERLGYHPAQSDDARERRRQTNIDVYGVEHPWMNPKIRQKCEVTTLELYGKHTWEIARGAVAKIDTGIERRTATLLSESGVEFVHPYVLRSGSYRREFDFYVPVCNTLIEVDGDYHHGNPMLYDALDRTQLHTRANDEFKNSMAKNLSIRLLRFWGADVLSDDFSVKLMEALWTES